MASGGGLLKVGVLPLQTAMMYLSDQGLGKKLLNIRVVRVNGCLHDLLADTLVVRAE
jgi:uncharacterized RDD family membrane protein YckC